MQPSTAGDVSNSESDDGETAEQAKPQAAEEPVERWRSFSEGEQVVCPRFSFLVLPPSLQFLQFFLLINH